MHFCSRNYRFSRILTATINIFFMNSELNGFKNQITYYYVIVWHFDSVSSMIDYALHIYNIYKIEHKIEI